MENAQKKSWETVRKDAELGEERIMESHRRVIGIVGELRQVVERRRRWMSWRK